ncbi:MAG: tyrosine-type recombinase/integrase [Azoarcus sp.]|nr:tyrosine-type recombinase/integrase [Azoarcus sp.]
MPLSDTAIRNAKPSAKPVKLTDGDGLYLLVQPNGARWWRFDYRIDGKRKTLSMGVYPDVSLKQAREKRDEARRLVAAGIDPSTHRKVAKAARTDLAENSFEAVGRKWFARQISIISETTKDKREKMLERDLFPYIGERAVSDIAAPDLLSVIKRIEGRGANDIAKRAHQTMGRIFRYAVAHGLCSRDPSRDIEIRDVLQPVQTRHHASITDPKEVGALLRAIDGFVGSFVTRSALKFAPLVFVRPGELRHAEWSEFDFDKAEWRIPAAKMKMKELHIVPLSRQALEVLKELHQLTGAKSYVFPSERGGGRPMSENTVNAALRRMGFTKDEMTGHGFRSTASTLLHELGYDHRVIERQLAHCERNQVSAAYNFAEYLPDRRQMMQQWADHLDRLRKGADVVPLRGNTAA